MSPNPRIRHNTYTQLDVPDLGAWPPTLGVSVVIPAAGDQRDVAVTLASLAAQSYPEQLLEVIVVGDNSSPLQLPEIMPANTTLVAVAGATWSPAHAVNTGVTAANHEVVLRLDAGMVVSQDYVAAHLRWHHVADYLAVVGMVRIIDSDATQIAPNDVYQAMSGSAPEQLFAPDRTASTWVDAIYQESDYLLRPGCRPFQVGDGGGGMSFRRTLHQDVGGLDAAIPGDSDIDFSYRLAQRGAVFVPERLAEVWCRRRPPGSAARLLGRGGDDDSNRPLSEPFVAHRVPFARDQCAEPGRIFDIPYVDIVIDAQAAPYEDAKASVLSALTGTMSDVRVTLVGAGDPEPSRPGTPAAGSDQVLLFETFRADSRVRLVTAVPDDSYPAPFRLRLPAGLTLTSDGLRRLVDEAERNQWGLVVLPYPHHSHLPIARLERTEAFARARRLRRPDENVEGVVQEIYGVGWLLGSEYALARASGPSAPRTVASLTADVEKYRTLADARATQVANYRTLAERRKADLERATANAAKWKSAALMPVGERIRQGIRRRLGRFVSVGGRDAQ